MKRDIAWAAAGSLVNDALDETDYDPLGSRTAFLKQTTNSVPIKCVPINSVPIKCMATPT